MVEDFSQWREELLMLHRQAETSLLIVATLQGIVADIMGVSSASLPACLHLLECVQLVMEDAKKKKRNWQQKLHDMKLMNLLQLRDSLMATASIHMMGVDNYKSCCEESVDQVTPLPLPLSLPHTFVICSSSSSSFYHASYLLYPFVDKQ